MGELVRQASKVWADLTEEEKLPYKHLVEIE
jgi:hypothetical protein